MSKGNAVKQFRQGRHSIEQLLAIQFMAKKFLAAWPANTKAQRDRFFRTVYRWDKNRSRLLAYYGEELSNCLPRGTTQKAVS